MPYDVNKILAITKEPESHDSLEDQVLDAIALCRRVGLIEASEYLRYKLQTIAQDKDK
jgi:hypothetical protein